MKNVNFTFLFTVLMSMCTFEAFAYDIAVVNADGKTIYYNYINNGTELEVTAQGSMFSGTLREYYTGDIIIPEAVTYMNRTRPVTAIGQEAFYAGTHGAKLTSISIPNSITRIGYRAFYGCSSLKTIEIPNSVTKIGAFAFMGCI